MKAEDINAIVHDVIEKHDNVAELTVLLDQLRTTLVTDDGEYTKVLAELDKLKKDNDELTKANGKLFLKLGEQITVKTPGVEETHAEKLDFDSLFNEKGGLK